MRAKPHQNECSRVGHAIDWHKVGPLMAVAVIFTFARRWVVTLEADCPFNLIHSAHPFAPSYCASETAHPPRPSYAPCALWLMVSGHGSAGYPAGQRRSQNPSCRRHSAAWASTSRSRSVELTLGLRRNYEPIQIQQRLASVIRPNPAFQQSRQSYPVLTFKRGG